MREFEKNMSSFPPLGFWLEKSELHVIESSAYWNNETYDDDQEFDVRTGNVTRMRNYLRTSKLQEGFEKAIVESEKWLGQPIGGIGVDVAAGACWAAGFLSRKPTIQRLYAVDISLHRLRDLAPSVCSALGAEPGKIFRTVGNFYHLNLADESCDFSLMSQAFHHAEYPHRLLLECRRVLRPGGVILVIGERPIDRLDILGRWLRNSVKRLMPLATLKTAPVRGLFPAFNELFPTDRVLGDHFYQRRDYQAVFKEASLQWREYPIGAGNRVFVLRKV